MAYYGLGTKTGILTDIETQLNTITDIQFVDWQRVEPAGPDPGDYPGIYINDVAEDKQRLLKDLVRNTFGISLVGWVWAEDDENLGTKINSFAEDIKDKIMTDPNRNENAYDTVIESVNTDGGSRWPQGMVIVNIAVLYFSQE